MADQNVSTTIEIASVLAAVDAYGVLTLEQEPYPDPEGENFTLWLSKQNETIDIFSIGPLYQKYLSACDENAGFGARVFVRTIPEDLPYTFEVTHGEKGERYQEEIDSSKRFTFELSDRVDTDKLITQIVSAEWEGPILDEFGQPTNPPPLEDIEIQGFDLVLPYILYGTVNLKFRERYDVYDIDIPKRSDEEADPEDPEAVYDTIAVAIHTGKIVQLKVEPPPLIGNCKGGYENKVDPDEPEAEVGCYNLKIRYHRCTGEEISREEIPVPCPESENE